MAKVVDYSNALTSPAWAGDFFDRDHMIPGGAKLAASDWLGVVQTITSKGAAALGATQMFIQPSPVAIPAGATVAFGAVNAVVQVDSPIGAGWLYVAALSAGVPDATAGTYTPDAATPIVVPSGTVVGRTIAERDAGTGYGVAAAADDEVYITCFDVYDVREHNDVELYRPNSIVKENFLPGFAAVAAGVKTKLRAAYVCTTGAA